MHRRGEWTCALSSPGDLREGGGLPSDDEGKGGRSEDNVEFATRRDGDRKAAIFGTLGSLAAVMPSRSDRDLRLLFREEKVSTESPPIFFGGWPSRETWPWPSSAQRGCGMAPRRGGHASQHPGEGEGG